MRLLSWNIQWCRGLDGVVDPARVAAEVRRLADPDIVCLQEVAQNFPQLPGSRGEDQFAALEDAFPGYHAAGVWAVDLAAPDGTRQRFGNLLLSRLPLGRVLRHQLPWPAGAEAPSMPRAALEASVEAPFGPLRIVTTHLEYYSERLRAAQIERLRALHAEAARHPRPGDAEWGPYLALPRPASAIVCGDFNLPPQDPLHARVREPFADGVPRLVDAWQALNGTAPHPPSFRLHERKEGQAPYCCDFVFVTEDLVLRLRALRIDGETRASDHQPVMLELE
jgi:endonuclease/exonuclease/phosphatase family metal-dependent hydrolase